MRAPRKTFSSLREPMTNPRHYRRRRKEKERRWTIVEVLSGRWRIRSDTTLYPIRHVVLSCVEGRDFRHVQREHVGKEPKRPRGEHLQCVRIEEWCVWDGIAEQIRHHGDSFSTMARRRLYRHVASAVGYFGPTALQRSLNPANPPSP